uniref:Protein-tyrosine-phosphatase n=1 Tax=Macrostomum lignano TaxID=282301 RepID=A0A1I8I4A8_9PLAT
MPEAILDAAGRQARLLLLCLALLAIAFLACPVNCQSDSCPSGRFGPYCNYSCSNCYDTASCLSLRNASGGCSDGICTKGFAMPPLCQTPCGVGAFVNRFGFNCSFVCHCNGSVGCDAVSGNCERGCDPAWIGPGCQTQLPAMQLAPSVISNDCAGLTVSFRRFNASVDVGTNSVEFYRLQMDNGSSGLLWYTIRDFLQVLPDPYNETMAYASLNANYSYRFRVIAKFADPFFTNFFGPASPASSAVKPVCIPPTVTTPPGVPPMGSFAISVVGSGLRATWNASQTPTLAAYNITITPLRTGDCANLTGPVTSVRVPVADQVYNFNPGTYWTTYQVSAFSILGTGEVSPTVTNTYTTVEAKPATPVTINLLGKGIDWLNFTWSPPACNLRLGAIREYQYFVYQISGSNRLEIAKGRPTAVQEVPVLNLVPFTVYNISVTYFNSVGSAPDAEISVTTDAARGPEPPINLAAVNVTSASAIITWAPPSTPKAPIADYLVQVTSPVAFTRITSGLSLQLDNLTSATAYTVQISSRSTNGSVGVASTSLTFTTLASSQQVASLSNSSRSPVAIILSWSPPSDSTNLVQFQISYTILETLAPGSPSVGVTLSVNETVAARSRSITDLVPSCKYRLCVTPVYSAPATGLQRCIDAWTTPGPFAVRPTAPTLLGSAGITTANISLSASLTYTGGPLTAYVVGVQLSSGASSRRRRAVAPASVDLAGYSIVAEFSPAGLPSRFLIGDGLNYGGYSNPSLSPSSTYNVRLAAYSLVDGAYAAASSSSLVVSTAADPAASTSSPTTTAAGGGGANIGLIVGLVILFILLLAAIAIGLYFLITRVLRPNSGKSYTAAYYTNGGVSHPDGGKGCEPRTADCWSATNSVTDSRRLLVEPGNYRAHASVMSCGTGVSCYDEFVALPQGYSPNRSCHTARNAANVTRNRSVQNLPYDHNLVRFKDANVYYNACYVNGYIRRQAYISAQSPTDKESAGDFWRIVAEQNVAQIVTLCLEFEAKSLHCIKYWPDVGNRAEFNGVQVRCQTEEYRNFYCKRCFKVNGLEVVQYQFLCWPETGMPKTAVPLIALYYAVKVASRIEDGPLLVHCSTALSRTAVFISLDYLLQQAMHEQSVSVFKCASHLRKARANCLPDPREYAFIYDLLFEAMLTEGRNIVRLDVREHLRSLLAVNPKLNQTHMWEHFAYLHNYTERPTCTSPTAGQADRDPDVMPCDDCRVRLADPTTYINAIWLDGFYAADDTIVTQTPLDWTELAFWTMVLEHRASHVVDLQPGGDPNRCFYPQPPETMRSLGQAGLTLRLQGRTDEGCTLMLECPGAQPLPVTLHSCTGLYTAAGGPQEASVPQSAKAMYKAVENFLQSPAPRSGPQVLVCLNGANRCGLFAACLLAAQQLQHEGFTDVYHLLPVQQQREPGRVAYHYLGQGDPGATLMSTAEADLV